MKNFIISKKNYILQNLLLFNKLNKIGLKLININITDITDDEGYIDALGKKAIANVITNNKNNLQK